MLRTLLESNAPRPRRRGSTAASIAVHAVIIGGAVVATASAKTETGAITVLPRDTVIYISPREEPRRRQESWAPSGPITRETPSVPRGPIWRIDVDANPNPYPPIDLDVRRLLRADSVPVGSISDGRSASVERGGEPRGDEPATVATVDRVAALLAPPQPRYPEQLRAAGVTGRVVVRLVVDTAGRIEPASVVIREASHELFAQAVRDVLSSLRFTPAEAAGRKVRMLVDLPFEFRLRD